ncbi:MAG: lipid-A-disaccharide synthase [Bacteroidetes bacterium GWF2_42_66]|nr:MAG: lipid-A-disaccharide synthase [Bacteroidetes bacterium GWA2_42_15]OFX99466.1 MAG: lipid-A-disaccharide synthase [Bacteroidetes bacterium GWE2_42_39]OFY46997.1 MAG: lipid-A-disaccharide synthase [Bacteroidetes bacterium GWF2_42_66]HBL76848.1 lipid-A-disaccharide synthase [Prolixibacteraceae bacterium]HCR90483.1 lipid-A-disaccharide synthase [Prolixibacteraceae bacterium]
MRYYFIAGEASGDLHAGNLIGELAKLDPEAVFQGFGGERMEKAGLQLIKHYRDMAFMGFIPVLMNLRTIKKNFRICEQDLLAFKPDVLILVDYPGFNLRMAKFAKANGIKVYYYISPKIWAWKKGRVHKIKALVDEMFTILPFETEFYRKYNYEVNYVGNPILDAVLERKIEADLPKFAKENSLSKKEIIALLPGSRKTEISYLLPVMLEASEAFPQYQFVVAGAPNMDASFYETFTKNYPVKVLWGKTYEIVQNSRAAMVASGTATLEVAILNTPQVVCYKMAGGAFFHLLGLIFITLKWVSLVNIILDREAVKELLQVNFKKKKLVAEMNCILNDAAYNQRILDDYSDLMQKLGSPGASRHAAEKIWVKLAGR